MVISLLFRTDITLNALQGIQAKSNSTLVLTISLIPGGNRLYQPPAPQKHAILAKEVSTIVLLCLCLQWI